MAYCDVEFCFVLHCLCEIGYLSDLGQYKVSALQRLRRGSDPSLDQSRVKLSHTYADTVSLLGCLYWLAEHLHRLDFFVLL